MIDEISPCVMGSGTWDHSISPDWAAVASCDVVPSGWPVVPVRPFPCRGRIGVRTELRAQAPPPTTTSTAAADAAAIPTRCSQARPRTVSGRPRGSTRSRASDRSAWETR